MVIESVQINGTTIGTPSTTRWSTRINDIHAENNSLLIAQAPDDGSFSMMANYIDIPLWNGLFEPSRILRGTGFSTIPYEMGDSTVTGFGLGVGMAMNTVTVNFRIEGLDAAPANCDDCGNPVPCSCGEARTPEFWAASGFVTAESRALWEADPTTTASIGDALQILRFVIDLSNEITGSDHAKRAGRITAPTGDPEIGDALQILRSVIDLSHNVRTLTP
jgi:hypothetical protein